MSILRLSRKTKRRSIFEPPLDGNCLRVHVMNSDPESALHGERAARPRTSWLAISIVLIGAAMLIWSLRHG